MTGYINSIHGDPQQASRRPWTAEACCRFPGASPLARHHSSSPRIPTRAPLAGRCTARVAHHRFQHTGGPLIPDLDCLRVGRPPPPARPPPGGDRCLRVCVQAAAPPACHIKPGAPAPSPISPAPRTLPAHNEAVSRNRPQSHREKWKWEGSFIFGRIALDL